VTYTILFDTIDGALTDQRVTNYPHPYFIGCGKICQGRHGNPFHVWQLSWGL